MWNNSNLTMLIQKVLSFQKLFWDLIKFFIIFGITLNDAETDSKSNFWRMQILNELPYAEHLITLLLFQDPNYYKTLSEEATRDAHKSVSAFFKKYVFLLKIRIRYKMCYLLSIWSNFRIFFIINYIVINFRDLWI